MNILKHALGTPFITATGIAALIHSTWSLGTFFAGTQPEGWHLVGWLVPALLIAFALDVGQIATSHEIRTQGLTVARGITFFVFALATYYLQWLYIAHHMPNLPLSAGISVTMQDTAKALRDMALWVIPALMPLSTLLYTFSSSTEADEKPLPVAIVQDEPVMLPNLIALDDTPLLPDEIPAIMSLPEPVALDDTPLLPEETPVSMPVRESVEIVPTPKASRRTAKSASTANGNGNHAPLQE